MRKHIRRIGDQRICREFERKLFADPMNALKRMRHRGKITLNSDDLFHLCPEYANDPTRRPRLGPKLYSIAKRFIDRSYRTLLTGRVCGNNIVVFTAGGSATGESTLLRAAGEKRGVDFLVDTTFSDTDRALAQLDRALERGRKVEVYYVYRDFRECVESMLARASDPACGRLFPIDDMARTRYGAQRAIFAAHEKYQGNPDVSIRLNKNVGRKRLSQLPLEEFHNLLHRSVDELQQLGQSVLDGFYKGNRRKRTRGNKDHNPRRRGLSIRFAIYEAARSKAQGAGVTSRESHA